MLHTETCARVVAVVQQCQVMNGYHEQLEKSATEDAPKDFRGKEDKQ